MIKRGKMLKDMIKVKLLKILSKNYLGDFRPDQKELKNDNSVEGWETSHI